jgi:parallel beta-helix repeat protein
VRDLLAPRNEFVGIALFASHDSRINRNFVSRNGDAGIVVSGSDRNRIAKNSVSDQPFSGRGQHRPQLGDDGIDVESPATTLARNLALHNGDFGIEAVTGVTERGRNKASGNGNPAQCTNIACK